MTRKRAVFQNLKSAAIFGTLGIGVLSIAYFSHAIDRSWNKSLHSMEELHHKIDIRLTNVEKEMKNRGKEQKMLQFRANTLCKFANLLNDNPTDQTCSQGFKSFNPGKAMKLMTPLMVAGSIGIGLAGNRGEDNAEEGVAEPENGPW